MTCCCDPPDIDLAIRSYTLPPDPCAGCSSGEATAITIGALLGSPGPLFEFNCPGAWTDFSGGTVSTTYGNSSYVSTSPSSSSPNVGAAWNACAAGVNEVVVRIQCGGASMTMVYAKSGGSDCKGTYTRSSSSTIFPATISVS